MTLLMSSIFAHDDGIGTAIVHTAIGHAPPQSDMKVAWGHVRARNPWRQVSRPASRNDSESGV